MPNYTIKYLDYSATVQWDDNEKAYVGAYWSACNMFGVEIIGRTIEEAQEDFKEGMKILLEDDNA